MLHRIFFLFCFFVMPFQGGLCCCKTIFSLRAFRQCLRRLILILVCLWLCSEVNQIKEFCISVGIPNKILKVVAEILDKQAVKEVSTSLQSISNCTIMCLNLWAETWIDRYLGFTPSILAKGLWHFMTVWQKLGNKVQMLLYSGNLILGNFDNIFSK